MTAPLASSGIVLGLGWLALYGMAASRNALAVALLQAMLALPFVYASISEGFRQSSGSIRDAARVLGAGPWQRLRGIVLPLASAHIRSALAFAAAMSLGELNSILMLGLSDWETLPLLIYRAAAAYRYGAACAAGTLLLLAAAVFMHLSAIQIPQSRMRES
jgi:thiamine transport system permease protein